MTGKVIDSSALAKYILKEEGWREVEGIILREIPYTLELAFKEAANAIWKRLALLGDISVEAAKRLLRDLMELRRVLRVEPQDEYLDVAFDIAVRCRITVYDALFIAQALRKKASLITADELQRRVAASLGLEAVLV